VTLYLEREKGEKGEKGEGGEELKVTIPEPAYDSAGLKIGDLLTATWPASAAHLFRQSA